MKRPAFRLQYEIDAHYMEMGSNQGAKLSASSVEVPEVARLLQTTDGMGFKATLTYLRTHPTDETGRVVVVPITTHTPAALRYRLADKQPRLVFLSRPLHLQEELDTFLSTANSLLSTNALLYCHSMTASLKQKLAQQHYPWGVRGVVMVWEYLWHRVCPKLWSTRWLYFATTKGKDRSYSRVELLGRLCRAGFSIVDERFKEGEYFVIAQKVYPPIDDTPPTGSPIIHLRRIGKGGKEIVVHKLRTMHTYSEYLQDYVYHHQSLEQGGKFKDDYRINYWGRFLRRTWLDELPMVWNLLRGDIKLIGVRPLSRQYYSLYRPELQQLRTQTKPGLLPPFYYNSHTPESLDDVQDSEQRYLEAYLQHPLRTDWRYFWGILANIIFHHKRSH